MGFLFFKNCHSAELNKIVEAMAPMNPYDNCMAASCLHMEAAQEGGYGHLTGTVSSSQAKDLYHCLRLVFFFFFFFIIFF